MKPQTTQDFECYVQSTEARMAADNAFVLADSDAALNRQLTVNRKIVTVPGNGPNPHKITGAMLYDWIGSAFLPGATVSRTVAMLQDYDHRASCFPEVIATSKLSCRTGENRFGFAMRMKEPSVMDVDSDVVWEKVDARHWRCRSYSTSVREVEKNHNYLLRLNTYWRFEETDKGVLVQGQSITLSGEFSSFMRTLGSMMGINPEKSLRKTLSGMQETMARPGLQFAPPVSAPACGAAIPAPTGCPISSLR